MNIGATLLLCTKCGRISETGADEDLSTKPVAQSAIDGPHKATADYAPARISFGLA